jgi:ElaB/YqjD/DUF883 family membrane-anchored ribosome-binding protein
MQQDIADTCQDIEDTRSAITEKLEILEERVRETVEGAQSSVGDIVDNVKDMLDTTVEAVRHGVEGAQSTVDEIVETVKGTVGDTVETVKRTLDVPYQVDQHPWLMFGGATLAGYLLGSWGGGSTSPAFSTNDSESSATGTTADMSASHATHDGLPPADRESSVPPPQQGMGSSLLEPLKDEMAMIKVAAVGALVSTRRAMVKQAVPTVAPHLEKARSERDGQPLERPPQPSAPMSRAGPTAAPSEKAGPGRRRQHAQPEERGVYVYTFVLLLFSLTRQPE